MIEHDLESVMWLLTLVFIGTLSRADDQRPPIPSDEITWFGGTENCVVLVRANGMAQSLEVGAGKVLAEFRIADYVYRLGGISIVGGDSPKLLVLVSGKDGRAVASYSLPEGRLLQRIELAIGETDKICSSPEGARVACDSFGRTKVWCIDTVSGKTDWVYDGSNYYGTFVNVLWRAQMPVLAFGDGDVVGTISVTGRRLWESAKDEELQLVQNFNEPVSGLVVFNRSLGMLEHRTADTGAVRWRSDALHLSDEFRAVVSKDLARQAIWDRGKITIYSFPEGDLPVEEPFAVAPEMRFTSDSSRLIVLPALGLRRGNDGDLIWGREAADLLLLRIRGEPPIQRIDLRGE